MTNDEWRMKKLTSKIKYSLKQARPEASRKKILNATEDAFWQIAPMVQLAVLREGPPGNRHFDLAERTAVFGEAVIRFAKDIPEGPLNNRLIDQLIGAATSVGANYCEADDGCSRRDFKHKIGLCRKEARETQFFLRMVASAEPSMKAEARRLWHEANELNLIFSAIWRRTKL
jgi:four helix bundle protein